MIQGESAAIFEVICLSYCWWQPEIPFPFPPFGRRKKKLVNNGIKTYLSHPFPSHDRRISEIAGLMIRAYENHWFPLRPAIKPLFLLGVRYLRGVGWLAMKLTITTQVIESNKNTNTPTQKKRGKKLLLYRFRFSKKNRSTLTTPLDVFASKTLHLNYIYIWSQQNYTKFSLNHALTQSHWRFFQLRFAVHLLVTPPKKKSLYYQPIRYAVNFGKSPKITIHLHQLCFPK